MTNATTSVPVRQDPTANRPPLGPRVVIGWLLLAVGLAATGVLILALTSSGPAPQPGTTPTPNSSLLSVPRNPEISERWLAHHSQMIGAGSTSTVPQRGVYAGWPAGVPRSADAAERWFAQQHQVRAGWPEGIHRSADAAERWFANRE
ncbi:MAG: hypothetical protein ACRDO4_09705 [Nocardioides sp.]